MSEYPTAVATSEMGIRVLAQRGLRHAFRGPIAARSEFRWKSGSSIVSRISEVEAPSRIAGTGKTMGVAAVHVWHLSNVDGRTSVVTEESFCGLLVRLFPGMMHKMLVASLEKMLADLKAASERR